VLGLPSIALQFLAIPEILAVLKKLRGAKSPRFKTVIVSDRRLPGVERSKSAQPALRPSACV
jgi:hypothetical protein